MKQTRILSIPVLAFLSLLALFLQGCAEMGVPRPRLATRPAHSGGNPPQTRRPLAGNVLIDPASTYVAEPSCQGVPKK